MKTIEEVLEWIDKQRRKEQINLREAGMDFRLRSIILESLSAFERVKDFITEEAKS